MVSKPAHNGCESWLQSVWAVGRHLSQYSSAVDAFAAPGTCKQLAPQITVICGGARETTMLYLNTHATCANASARYLAHTPAKIRAQNRHPVSVHCIEGAPAHQSTSQYHKSARGQLTRQCYRTPLICIEDMSLMQETLEA
jgi:hypothetical protein